MVVELSQLCNQSVPLQARREGWTQILVEFKKKVKFEAGWRIL